MKEPVLHPCALSAAQLADAIDASAYWAYTNSFGGTSGTHARSYFDWTQRPRTVGELVVEISARGRRPAHDRVGVLLSIAPEPYPDWDEELNGPASTRDIWTIQRLDGSTIRWENCMFIPVPSAKNPWHRI